MRRPFLPVLVLLAVSATAAARAEAPAPRLDRDALRADWHRCVKDSFSGQPATMERKAAEQAALASCKPAEDAYVAAEIAARNAEEAAGQGRGEGLTSRAKAWMASVASHVVDPVSALFASITRRAER